jgi:hypothetical protein
MPAWHVPHIFGSRNAPLSLHRYVLGECGALKSQLSSDPRMDHIKRMLKSVPLAGDSSDDD